MRGKSSPFQPRLVLEYILAVPAKRYGDFDTVLASMTFDADSDSLCEGTWQGRRIVVAHEPERADVQRQCRQAQLDELTQLGERLAARLDGQDSGTLTRGRRTSDRGAYARFSRAVHDAHCSRFITPRLDSELFAFDLNDAAIKKAEQFHGKLILVTNVSDLAAEDIIGRYKALADIEIYQSYNLHKSHRYHKRPIAADAKCEAYCAMRAAA